LAADKVSSYFWLAADKGERVLLIGN
jgi:hypothetical protein